MLLCSLLEVGYLRVEAPNLSILLKGSQEGGMGEERQLLMASARCPPPGSPSQGGEGSHPPHTGPNKGDFLRSLDKSASTRGTPVLQEVLGFRSIPSQTSPVLVSVGFPIDVDAKALGKHPWADQSCTVTRVAHLLQNLQPSSTCPVFPSSITVVYL